MTDKDRLLAELGAELDRKWGGIKRDDKHTPSDWLGFIEMKTADAEAENDDKEFAEYRKCLFEVARLSISAIAALDRSMQAEQIANDPVPPGGYEMHFKVGNAGRAGGGKA